MSTCKTPLVLACLALIGLTAPPLPPASADELQGRLEENNAPSRVQRPPTPVLDSPAQQFQSKVRENVFQSNMDAGNFDLNSNAWMQRAMLDNSHWNPWRTRISAYKAPIHTGGIADYGRVEARWPASVETRAIGAGTETITVSLAMCPMPQYRDAWQTLMEELRTDGGNGPWKKWQDDVCARLAEEQARIGPLNGPWFEHVAITRDGTVICGRPGAQGNPDRFQAPYLVDNGTGANQAEVEQQAIQALGLRIPSFSQVPELHFRVSVHVRPQFASPMGRGF